MDEILRRRVEGWVIGGECVVGILTRMDVLRLGRAIRAVRRHRRWTQHELADRAGVSRPMVTRIEAGQVRAMPLDKISRVCVALEIQLDLVPRWKGEGLDRLLDAKHARLVEALVRRYQAGGWEVAVEASFAIGAERGSVDVLAAHSAVGVIAINEVKSVVPDAQATLHALDRKTRLALRIAAERGLAGTRVARFLVIADGRTARRRIAALTATFDAAFPIRGRQALAWIDAPAEQIEALRAIGQRPRLVSGLLFMSSVHGLHAADRLPGHHRVTRPRGVRGAQPPSATT